MRGLQISEVQKTLLDVGIDDVRMAADIIRMVIELQDNGTIISHLQKEYNINGKGTSIRRKFNSIIQSFIIHNYYDNFTAFCKKNDISIFNEDLDVTKESASYARMIFIIFLRESVGLKPMISIVEDMEEAVNLHDHDCN